MREYFETYGDQAPNSTDVAIPVMSKRDLYNRYVEEMNSSLPPRSFVDEPRFKSLWLTLFPNDRLRQFCTIPGKCLVCSKIDEIRTDNLIVLNKCKEAHLLHRGGLFMRERDS